MYVNTLTMMNEKVNETLMRTALSKRCSKYYDTFELFFVKNFSREIYFVDTSKVHFAKFRHKDQCSHD